MFLLSSKTTEKVLTIAMLILLPLIVLPDGDVTLTNGVSEYQIVVEEPGYAPRIMYDVSTPILAKLSIDDYPLVGQPATLTCEISSMLDAPNTTAQIELPANARLLDGNLNWQGDLLANTPSTFSATIVFDTAGDAAVFCRAHRIIDAENSWGDLAELYMSIGQTGSQEGFPAPTPEERDRLGELAAAGDGQTIDEATRQPAPSREGQILEPPPSVDPSLSGDMSATSYDGVSIQGDLTITGRWRFYDRDDNLSSEQMLVEVVRGDNSNHLAWCYTDSSGYYSCGPFTNPGSAGVRSRFLSYTNFSPYSDVLVTVNPDWGTTGSQDNAFGTTTSVQTFSDGTHDIGSWYVPNSSTYERAYWITVDLIRVWKYIWFGTGSSQSPQETTGPGTVQWKIDSTDGTYYSRGGNIHLTGADPLSNTTVGHEYGHNIMYTVYGNWMPTTYCPNPHSVNLSSHVNCAWTEGWANFIPLAVNNDPVYRWASGASLNLENPTWGSPGWDDGDDVEGRVAGALWDMLDTANEGDDQYSDGGIVNIWDTLFHQNDNNFSQYWSAWKSRGHNNTSAGPVMSIFQSTIDYRNGPANDDFGNATFIGSVPYVVMNFNTANATTQGNDPNTSCGSISTPKQSRSVWYRYTPASTGNYSITTNGSNYDTVLSVWTGSFGSLTNRGCDDDSGTGTQSSLTLALYGGITYYIEAMSYGSGSGGLLTLNVVGSPPPVPANVQASDGIYTDRVRVTWNSVAGATYYEVYRATSSGGIKTMLSSPTSTTYDDTSAVVGTTYYYWVKACNSYGCSDYSAYNTGWRRSASPPGRATLISPEGVIGDTTPTYTWMEVSTSTWYRLWVDGPSGTVIDEWYRADEANCVGGVCGVTPTTVLAGGLHTWWIQTWNDAGYGPWSRGLNFWVGELDPPGPAPLLSPSGATSDTTPTYSWEEVETATWYRLWVDDALGVVVNQWYQASDMCAAGTCSVTPDTTLGEGPHEWWVQTWNIAGYGPWSTPMNFYVGTPGAPGPATLQSPSGVIGGSTPAYTWQVAGTATWYRLLVEGPSGTAVNQWYKAMNTCDRASGVCEVTPDTVLEQGEHSWWVKSWNPYGSTWSGRLDFSVSSVAAGVPSKPGVSGDANHLYLPLVVKSAGPSQMPSPQHPIDDGDEDPPIEMRMSDSGPQDVGEESGPPIEALGPGSGPPPGADEADGPPVNKQ